MVDAQRLVTVSSSWMFRMLAYIFLRWPIPPILIALFIIYLAGFTWITLTTTSYNVIADDIAIVTKPALVKDAGSIVTKPNAKPNGRDADIDDVGKPLLGPDGEQLEELDVRETVYVEQKRPRTARSLLHGLPSPSSSTISVGSLLVNVVLLLMILDYCYRSRIWYPAHDLSFSRLGYVSHKTANILVREPDQAQLPLLLSYRFAHRPRHHAFSQFDGAWKHAATVDSLTNKTDFTAALTIADLQPDTRYQYILSNNHKGTPRRRARRAVRRPARVRRDALPAAAGYRGALAA
ncbi:hypothetical protein FH972_024593 [Carpinus fangiana]|uniref:Uncharacterized protein n=1 Tax=Carpinus fangiana TaxID=176857 RepID=A0A5N6KYF4_9ROSI|nr:hypothetical protein FH972_024593 [Carpinus fangiana]